MLTTMKHIRVAIVGAGSGGLAALRLLNHGPDSKFKATAFEMTPNIGGTWFYTDLTGVDENGLPIHSSMYKNLKTNLPKECMLFPDFPFASHLPSFMKHQDVQKYLEEYATHFDLWKDIKFKTIVKNIKPIPDENSQFGVKWEVKTVDTLDKSIGKTEDFDAVLVCNGHYADPAMPDIPGLDTFGGHLMHSHHYREPSAYANKTVIVLGAQSSGKDICLEVSHVATQVYLCHNKPKLSTVLPTNVYQKPGIKHCHKRLIEFNDGSALEVDAIILCTGYEYNFSFLDESCGITVDDNYISPLFKHLLSIDYPSLGLIGISKTVLPFPLFYMQIQYFRSILDGTANVPSKKEMIEDEKQAFNRHTQKGLPKRYFHILSDAMFDYFRELADLGKFDRLPDMTEKIYMDCHIFRRSNFMAFRNLKFEISDDGEEVTVVDGKTNVALGKDNLEVSYEKWWRSREANADNRIEN